MSSRTKAIRSWFWRLALVAMTIVFFAVLFYQAFEAPSLAQQVCDSMKAQGATQCQIDPATVVAGDNGHAFLIIKDKIYKLF